MERNVGTTEDKISSSLIVLDKPSIIIKETFCAKNIVVSPMQFLEGTEAVSVPYFLINRIFPLLQLRHVCFQVAYLPELHSHRQQV